MEQDVTAMAMMIMESRPLPFPPPHINGRITCSAIYSGVGVIGNVNGGGIGCDTIVHSGAVERVITDYCAVDQVYSTTNARR